MLESLQPSLITKIGLVLALKRSNSVKASFVGRASGSFVSASLDEVFDEAIEAEHRVRAYASF